MYQQLQMKNKFCESCGGGELVWMHVWVFVCAGSSHCMRVYSCMCAMCMYRGLHVLVEARAPPSVSFFRNGMFYFSRQDLTLTGHWQGGCTEWRVIYTDSLLSPSLLLGIEECTTTPGYFVWVPWIKLRFLGLQSKTSPTELLPLF